MLCYVFYFKERPGEVISSTNVLEPSCLGGENCGSIEVTDDKFDAWQFVYVVDGLAWPTGRHDILDMIKDVVGCWDFI